MLNIRPSLANNISNMGNALMVIDVNISMMNSKIQP
jgi:hypothetical protein